jgi:hypothetical protein
MDQSMPVISIFSPGLRTFLVQVNSVVIASCSGIAAAIANVVHSRPGVLRDELIFSGENRVSS